MTSPQLPEMPVLGLGLWKADKGQTEIAVYEALKLGYRHLDGACDYGDVSWFIMGTPFTIIPARATPNKND